MRSPTTKSTTVAAIATLNLCAMAGAQVDPTGRSILFVRGADGSGGGATGGTFQERTAQLSDVFDNTTWPGNAGYGELRALLVADGFQVGQWIESSGTLTLALLTPHRLVVMGSNNRQYTAAEVQAFHDYVDRGGSALFVSDANWGPAWGSAPISDNLFLARYGIEVLQDNGQVRTLLRADPGRYTLPDHPVLAGSDGLGGTDVNAFDGEGVSAFRLSPTGGFGPISLVTAIGDVVRLNTPSGAGGAWQMATPADHHLVAVERGATRIVGHFDRNTFFNANGAGTDLTRFDNARLALGIFRFLAAVPATARHGYAGCGALGGPLLLATPPILGRDLTHTATAARPGVPAFLLASFGGPAPTAPAPGCTLWPAAPSLVVWATGVTDAAGQWQVTTSLPDELSLAALRLTTQAVLLVPGGVLLGGGELSSAVVLTLGYPR